VLLKVNLLMVMAPDKAVTTHPSVVKAAIELLEGVGAKVVVGDSPAMGFTKARLEKCYRKSGMYDAIDGTGAELNWDFGTVRASNPGGKLVKNFELIKVAADVDKIVSMPKLKTHSFTTFTGAVKIHFGMIPGYVKAGYHAKLPDPRDFSEMLLDVALYAKPALIIMDGVVGMDGNGPSGGDLKDVGVIMAGSDPVAMDVVATTLVKMDPLSVPTIERAVARGISSGKASDIDILGAKLGDFAHIKFKAPVSRKSRVPKFMMDAVSKRWMKRPMPDPMKCVACGECAAMCPKKCITVDKVAKMNYSKCIRCYCCHEVCPHKAIDLI